MRKNVKSLLALTSGSTLLLSPLYVLAHPCDNPVNKNSIHCAYLASSENTGKYIKIKETQAGRAPVSMMFCAAPGSRPIMNIPQNLWGRYQPGDQINWQFSQCLDEDCNNSKILLDDKFTITKNGNVYSSASKKLVEVDLDPGYGMSCNVESPTKDKKVSMQKTNVAMSWLQINTDSAASMVESIPTVVQSTSTLLGNMDDIAKDAASGRHSRRELYQLNKRFQELLAQIDTAQNVYTVQGYKKVSNGTLDINIGFGSTNFNFGIPATDVESLGVSTLNVLTVANAQDADQAIQTAKSLVDELID